MEPRPRLFRASRGLWKRRDRGRWRRPTATPAPSSNQHPILKQNGLGLARSISCSDIILTSCVIFATFFAERLQPRHWRNERSDLLARTEWRDEKRATDLRREETGYKCFERLRQVGAEPHRHGVSACPEYSGCDKARRDRDRLRDPRVGPSFRMLSDYRPPARKPSARRVMPTVQLKG